MPGTAGIVLAGGRSSRMGAAKAALEWHGSTLLRRTAGVLARATAGPVVVVRAPGQALPPLPAGVEVVDDPREGLGPVQGLAAGLAALAGRAEIAFVSATDLPFLHPAFVRRVLGAVREGADVGLPVAHGYQQPLAAGYRTALAPLAAALVARGQLRPGFLFAECAVIRLDEAALRADPAVAALDPCLDSVVNVNSPQEYRAARARPAPEVSVHLTGAVAAGPDGADGADGAAGVAALDGAGEPDADGADGPRLVRAATLAGAAAAAGRGLGQMTVTVNGERVAADGQLPLVTGDAVVFGPAGG